jgi:hypothetical protein
MAQQSLIVPHAVSSSSVAQQPPSTVHVSAHGENLKLTTTVSFVIFCVFDNSLYLPAVCGGVISAVSGVIQSPGYPLSYPAFSNCSWFIRVANGRTVGVTFNGTFNIPSTAGCGTDYVQVSSSSSAFHVSHYVVACELVFFYCPTLWQDATVSSLRLRWDRGRDEGEIEESHTGPMEVRRTGQGKGCRNVGKV